MILSLYSGCGGLDLGFERAGYTVGLAYDICPYAIASWNRNRSDGERGHTADLSTIRLQDMDRDHGGRFVPAGVIGGHPCQGFSRANHLRSSSDVRRKMVRRFFTTTLRFHRSRKPLKFILLENVPELAGKRHAGLLKRELERLSAYDFAVHPFLVNAVRHSVPQYRQRIFYLALPKTGEVEQLWLPPVGESPLKTVRETIGEVPDPAFFRRGMRPEDIPLHPNHWCMNPKSPKFANGSLKEGYFSGRSFKTLAWDTPSITVSYGHREVHVHPSGKRRLSVFEAMRLQGFPDNFVLEGTLSAQIDQVMKLCRHHLRKQSRWQ